MSDARLPSHDLDARVAEAVGAIRARTNFVHRVGIRLGSGLGGVVDALDGAVVFPAVDLPHWPRSTVHGHAGLLAPGHWHDVPVAALSGRGHRYEGYSLDRVTFAVRGRHKATSLPPPARPRPAGPGAPPAPERKWPAVRGRRPATPEPQLRSAL
jgi:hypothetical protein